MNRLENIKRKIDAAHHSASLLSRRIFHFLHFIAFYEINFFFLLNSFIFFSLVFAQVNIGSIADQAGLVAGDSVIKVNNVDVYNLRHKDAQDLIVRSGNSFDVLVQRGGSTWAPHVAPTGALPSPHQQYGGTVTKTSLQHHPPPNEAHIGCGYNNSARPFNQNGGPVKSIVNKQYNTPVGIYSDQSIAETLTAQAEVLANGVLG